MKTISFFRKILIFICVTQSLLACSSDDDYNDGDECIIFNWVYTDCECDYTEDGCADIISTDSDEILRLQDLLDASGQECLFVEHITTLDGTMASGYIRTSLNRDCLNFDWDWGY